ncbi:hypothetical protein HPB52_012456 [Rhipicephalus sanguineus]|uniref:Uncharacterized protein n=1 Tax=Rhipicephalus sanguineus TaxID=34632 RepID=A0A9D4T9Z2_RHISA|nr:hypothetical protein HPB52_012456 [Rhipicephalus sanguineus]
MFGYVPLSERQSPAQPRRQGPGILKYPFGFCDTPKEHSVKTLRFEMDQLPEPAQRLRDGTDPSVNNAEDAATRRSSISSASTAGAENDEESGEGTEDGVPTPSSPTSTVESVDLIVSGGKSSSASSGWSEQLDAGSNIASSSARTSFTSVSSRSIPKDINRYFLGHAGSISETSNTQLSTSFGAGDQYRDAGHRRDSWRATSLRYALLAALATLSTLLLTGISAELYGTLIRGAKERTPLMLLENTIGLAPPEAEGRAMAVVPPRVVYRGGRRYGYVTPERKWGTDAADGEQEVHNSEASVANPDQEPSPTVAAVDQEVKEVVEPTDLQEIIGDGKETLWAAFKFHNGSPCGAPSFTYCQRPQLEFFYESATGACLSTATHRLGVCIRGSNSGDVLSTWWHFDGRSCKKWNFTSGLCPAHGDDGAFSSREECLATCAGRRGRSRLCRVSSRPDQCYSDQLRFPYFAAAGNGKRRPLYCVKVSSTNYHGHHCLVGANRFISMKACLKTCVSNRSDNERQGSRVP